MNERTSHQPISGHMSGTPDTWPLSASDAARLIGVSERTIRRAIARGELIARKHGGMYRIVPDDLAAYRDRKGIGAPSSVGERAEPPALPRPPTPLIGRAQERAEARRLLLEAGAALVTLTGPGGVGKTRLAIHIATEVAASFDDGACFVDVSPVRDPGLVLPSIAQAIGVRVAGMRDAAEAVGAYLRPRQVLLVLDNCEQVVSAAPSIAALLARCPALQIVATSRAPLRLRAEHRLPVPPFAVPSPDEPADRLAGSDAIRLFLDRARVVHPAFAPDAHDLRAISEMCRRLDGLPLAIELAAARSALLPPRALFERLADRSLQLADGPRDLPDRQRTMRDAIAWSYDLLDAEERVLFRRLGVFVGGFDLDAAIAISSAAPSDTLDRIGRLVEQSLLGRVERAGADARFVLLDTVRAFALEQLRAHGEIDAVRGLHAEHYLTLAEHIETVLYGSQMRRHLDRLEIEHANCLAARTYFVEIGDAARELRLVGMLSEYWYYRGQISEGIAALQGALARGAEAPPGPRAKVMSVLGFLHWTTGAVQQALLLLSASVPLAHKAGDVDRLAKIQYMWAHVLRYQEGRRDDAISLLEDVVGSTSGHQPVLDVYPAALDDLGDLWLLQGDRDRGLALLNQALSLFQDLADQLGVGQAHLRLGRLARQDGATIRAADHLGQSLRAYRETGVLTQAGLPLAELQDLVTASGYPDVAARIAGMVQAVTDRTGATFDDDRAHPQPSGHKAPGQDFQSAFKAGRALPFDDALTDAIAIADALAAGTSPPGETGRGPTHPPVPLSPRERDVLALLAQRYTAPEMADQLYLSVRTVERHVSNLYNKLGVNSRRAATAVAVRHGLV